MKGKKNTEGILVSSHRGNHSNTFSGARKRLDLQSEYISYNILDYSKDTEWVSYAK